MGMKTRETERESKRERERQKERQEKGREGESESASEELETNNFAFRANGLAYVRPGPWISVPSAGRIRILKFTTATRARSSFDGL